MSRRTVLYRFPAMVRQILVLYPIQTLPRHADRFLCLKNRLLIERAKIQLQLNFG